MSIWSMTGALFAPKWLVRDVWPETIVCPSKPEIFRGHPAVFPVFPMFSPRSPRAAISPLEQTFDTAPAADFGVGVRAARTPIVQLAGIPGIVARSSIESTARVCETGFSKEA